MRVEFVIGVGVVAAMISDPANLPPSEAMAPRIVSGYSSHRGRKVKLRWVRRRW